MREQLLALGLGSLMGLVLVVALLWSGHLAARFGRDMQLLELAIRLGVFGLMIIGAAEVIGAKFGPLVRAQAAWFFAALAVLFLGVPWVFAIASKRSTKRHDR